jgi:hypothetical protein
MTRTDTDDAGQEVGSDLIPLPAIAEEPDEVQTLHVNIGPLLAQGPTEENTAVDSARLGQHIFVAVADVCRALGVGTQNQMQRIRRQEILGNGLRLIKLPTPGGPQDKYCLDADLLPVFLLTIQVSKTRPELRRGLLAFQIRMASALRDAYYAEVLSTRIEFRHLIRLVHTLRDEVRRAIDGQGEIGTVLGLILHHLLGPQPAQLPANTQLPTSVGRPNLRIVSSSVPDGPSRATKGAGTGDSASTSMFVLPDDQWGTGVCNVEFDSSSTMLTLMQEGKCSIVLSPGQALQLAAVVRAREEQLRLAAGQMR